MLANLWSEFVIDSAADNLDFIEDAADGKNTLHATIIVAYQQTKSNDNHKHLEFLKSSKFTFSNIPDFMSYRASYIGPNIIKPNILQPGFRCSYFNFSFRLFCILSLAGFDVWGTCDFWNSKCDDYTKKNNYIENLIQLICALQII